MTERRRSHFVHESGDVHVVGHIVRFDPPTIVVVGNANGSLTEDDTFHLLLETPQGTRQAKAILRKVVQAVKMPTLDDGESGPWEDRTPSIACTFELVGSDADSSSPPKNRVLIPPHDATLTDGLVTARCAIVDAGPRGLAVHCDVDLEPDTVVTIGTELFGTQWLVKVRIAYCQREDGDREIYRLGLEMLELDRVQHALWTRFLLSAETSSSASHHW